ncbi:putative phospholipid import ATP-binding protein MlaF [Novipirellula aureliae]|uniref:Putative phospholipid import ATP-binding protein MlaF n=1 Tax=Novipirellula aureliae TaxID=2527966 RepID=A0A5C6E8B4_9BACT|nr:hypothetical protein [Novipirellula aureliae]TWU43921.1 putative phospholipid import ATP-binding protein MlaF [Novipirellula aureliae]
MTTIQTTIPNEKPIVLRLSDVSFRASRESDIHFNRLTMTVRQGDLAMIHLDRSQKVRETVSVLEGLIQPHEGTVLFEQNDWLGDDYDRHFRMRSRIGRVFENNAWIQNLNIAENVTLARRHHQMEPKSIDTDLTVWRTRFDVANVLNQRPAFVEPSTLQVYQWIRSLISKPRLLLLERPMQSVSPSRLTALVNVLNEVRMAGTAVVWFTSNPEDASGKFADPQSHYTLADGKLVQTEGASSP